MNKDLIFRKLLFVYQMPKTGSQTVEATLGNCALPHLIFRFHYLGDSTLARLRAAVSSENAHHAWKAKVAKQMEMATLLSTTIRRRRLLRCCGFPIPKLEVITGVRELIGLGLSSIFENYPSFASGQEFITPELCSDVLQRPQMFTELAGWFDSEVKRILGIDVYSAAFPKAKGYTIFENRHARLLLYRVDALRKLPAMLREFLNCEVGQVVNRNIGSEKHYAQQYASIKEQLRLPKPFVDDLYSSKLMRHFYSADERRELALQWSEDARMVKAPA